MANQRKKLKQQASQKKHKGPSKAPLWFDKHDPPKVHGKFGSGKKLERWIKTGFPAYVISSNVHAIAYDLASTTLMVQFTSGFTYLYNVTVQTAEDMFAASTMGGFVWQRFRRSGVTRHHVKTKMPLWRGAKKPLLPVRQQKTPAYYGRD